MGHAPLPGVGTHFGCQIATTVCRLMRLPTKRKARRKLSLHAASMMSGVRPACCIRRFLQETCGVGWPVQRHVAGTQLAPGVSRSLIGLFWLRTFEPGRILFVDAGELDQVFDSEVSECLDAVVSGAINPDDAILDLHVTGDVSQPVFVFAEVLGDTRDRGDVMELVDVHIRTARAKSAALRDHDYSPCFHKSDMKC